jgi:hypothetical protein
MNSVDLCSHPLKLGRVLLDLLILPGDGLNSVERGKDYALSPYLGPDSDPAHRLEI